MLDMSQKDTNKPPRLWVEVVNENGTSVKTHRQVETSSRGGQYVKFCGEFYKLPTSGALKVKRDKGRATLP